MNRAQVDAALSFLSSLAPAGVRLGLDRIHFALRELKSPHDHYPVLHVAGTNGKGSTCSFAATCLTTQGYRVGLYTSPHLVRVNERIRIDGRPISDELLAQRIDEVLAHYPAAASTPAPLTYFEFGTLLALWHFARENCDVVVLETGLGGRLDATSATTPLVTAITPISLDHMDYLGHTLAAIAGEKAGIIKAGVPVVCARQEDEALEVLEQRSREVGAPLKLEGRDFALVPEPGSLGTWVYHGMRTTVPRLWLALRGEHQAQNAAVALASLELLEDRGVRISQESARAGLATTEWPGRLEQFLGSPLVVLDGAHNPAGALALRRALDTVYQGRRVHAVFGVLADKDHRPMLRTLFPRFATAHLVPVNSPRSLTPDRYYDEARSQCADVAVYRTVGEALAGARRAAKLPDVILGTGSLFLVGELSALLEGRR